MKIPPATGLRGGRWGLGILALLIAAVPAGALDPGKLLTQYTYRSWLSADGLPQNTVFSVAQTPEGYLWLATLGGLARFDGLQFEVFDRSNTPQLTIDQIYALATDAAGDLWIGTNGGGLLRYRDGAFELFTEADGLPGQRVSALAADPGGALCIGTYDRGVALWDRGKIRSFGANRELPDGVVYALAPRGQLFALDLADGRQLWARQLQELFDAAEPYFGFTTSPLASGDLLFVDSSHVVKAGSDVNYVVLEVLPRLRPGVIVQVHDVYLPYDYQRNLYQTVFHWNESTLYQAFLTDQTGAMKPAAERP